MKKTFLFSVLLFCLFFSKTVAQTFSWDNSTVYFLLIDRFNDGNTTNNNNYGRSSDPVGGFMGGDIAGITAKINANYFNDLGVDALWISSPYEQMHSFVPGYSDPAFQKHFAYHGYWPLDWSKMDKNYGTKNEFQTMVDAAHSHGLRVVMDIVMNHFAYENAGDMAEFNYGNPNNVNDNTDQRWCNWWGQGWVRKSTDAGLTIPCASPFGGAPLQITGFGLPDIKTESTETPGLPPILINKWTKEGTLQAEQNSLNTFFTNKNLAATPRNHLVKWLTDWVREYGIDGFRIDTYKHVEPEAWGVLNTQAAQALNEWKIANPTKKLDNTPFWSVGEDYGAGFGKDNTAVNVAKMDAKINFNFKGSAGSPATLEATYSSMASTLNNDPTWNTLSYISSHDVGLFDRNDLFDGATSLLMAPGAVQIFYGDESGRPNGTTSADDQKSRSFMNWGSINTSLSTHWKKIGQFRKKHMAIGAGSHAQITASSGYAFKRELTNSTVCDAVIVVVGASGSVSVNVSSVFSDGTVLKNGYDNTTATVSNGQVVFAAGSNGVILIENSGSAICKPNLTITATPSQGNSTNFYSPTSLTVSMNSTSFTGATDKKIFYTTNGTTPSPTSSQYTSTLSFGNPTNLTLKAIACENNNTVCSAVETRNVVVGALPDITVYFRKPSSWANPTIYYWAEVPTGAVPAVTFAAAPAMTAICNGWFKYTFTGVQNINFLIKGGSNQTADFIGLSGNTWADASALSGTNIAASWTNTAPASLNGLPSVTASPSVSGNFFNSQVVNLTPVSCGGTAPIIYYTTDGSTPTTASTSSTAALSLTFAVTTTLKYFIKNSEGESAVQTLVFTKQAAPSDIVMYFKKPTSWGNAIKIHYWPATSPAGSTTVTSASTYPGVAMTAVCNGWYKYTFTGITSVNVLFNDGTNKTTDQLSRTATAWADASTLSGSSISPTWSTTSPASFSSVPVLSVSPAGPLTFSNTQNVTLTASSCETTLPTIYYTTNGTTPTTSSSFFTGTGTLTFNSTTTLKTYAVNASGASAVQTYVYTKQVATVVPDIVVYFKKPAAWTNTKIYFWSPITPAGSVAVPASTTWPGLATTTSCSGWVKFVFKGMTSVNVIFNNGSSGAANQTTDIVAVSQTTYFDGSTTSGFRPAIATTVAPAVFSTMLSVTPQTQVTQPTVSLSTGKIQVTNPTTNVSYSFDGGTTYGTSATSSPLGVGVYKVLVKNTNHCESSPATVTINSPTITTARMDVSSEKINENKIALYPNPVRNMFTLEGENIELSSFGLSDIAGKSAKIIYKSQKGKVLFNTSHLQKGNYFLSINTNGKRLVKKIVVIK